MRTASWVRPPTTFMGGASLSMAQAREEARRQRSTWTDSMMSTSHAEIAVRQTFGPGLPVLFLHGLSGSKAVFTRQLGSSLGADYRMIAFDWPGCGRSGQAFEPERTGSVEGYADLAVEVLERLGIDEVVVVGWETGGLAGLDLATIFPGLVGLMTIRLPRGQGLSDGSDASAFMAGLIPNADAFADQGRIPLVLVDGEADRACAMTDRTDPAILWGACHHVIPGAGGAPFRERPEVFNAVLGVFLRQMEERHGRMLADPPCTHGA